jgi:hypothetical protein
MITTTTTNTNTTTTTTTITITTITITITITTQPLCKQEQAKRQPKNKIPPQSTRVRSHPRRRVLYQRSFHCPNNPDFLKHGPAWLLGSEL